MKIADEMKFDHTENRVIHKRSFDLDSSIKEVKEIRDQGFATNHAEGVSESYLVGRLPMPLVNEMLKAAGVTWDDPAAKDVVMRALQSGEFDKFRVWGGNLGVQDKIVVGPDSNTNARFSG